MVHTRKIGQSFSGAVELSAPVFPVPVSLESLPQHLIDVVLAGEDRRFWYHPGFDPLGQGRALVGLATGRGLGGGSTITQQLAKLVFLDSDRSLARKLREWLLAANAEEIRSGRSRVRLTAPAGSASRVATTAGGAYRSVAGCLDCTLAICTRNRAASLARTLEGLRRLILPTGLKWELLVIDNGSLDTTREVLEGDRSQLPIRCVPEPCLGLSHARNRALENARGELILWTDDDVIVDPRWLVEHVEGARKFPSATFFGGPIVPRFVAAPPRWLHHNLKEFGGAFAVRALGPGQRWIRDRSELPYGANFSVRRAALGSLTFAPELGRSPQDMLFGEETHLLTTLLKQGAGGAWLGDAVVEHMVAPERMNRHYIWSYFYATGRSEVRSGKLSGVPSASLPWLEAKHAKMTRRLRWSFVRGPRWAASFRRTAKLAGAIAELRE